MKKSLLIALVGFMFVAFASCSCGSKPYKEAKANLEKIEKSITDAKSCEDLTKPAEDLVVMSLATAAAATENAKEAVEDKDKKDNKEEEKMTADEQKKIADAIAEVGKKLDAKKKDLCKE